MHPERRLRVILDTNVFVAAAFRPRSASGRIIEAARKGDLLLVWNAATRREARAILERIPRIRWADFAPLFRDADEVDEPADPERFAADIPDPDDRKFAALALASGAPLVSSDGHLLAVPAAAGIAVVTPAQFASTHLPPVRDST